MKYLKLFYKNNNYGKIERHFYKIEVAKIKKTIVKFKKDMVEISIKYGLFGCHTLITNNQGVIRVLGKIKSGGQIISINPYGF